MPYTIYVKKPDNTVEAHLCDTKEQVVSALFCGNPPEGLKFEDIKHATGAHVVHADKFVDHR